jgi:hypothetical protein
MNLLFGLLFKVAIIEILNDFDLVEFNKHFELHLVHLVFRFQQPFVLLDQILSLNLELFAQVTQVVVFYFQIAFCQLFRNGF